MRLGLLALVLSALALAGGCPAREQVDGQAAGAGHQQASTAATAPLIIWADAALEQPLTALAKEYRDQTGTTLAPLFLERGELRRELTEAPDVLPDVFITGDAVSAEWLAAEGFSAAVTARVIAGDRLALLSTAGLGFEAGTLFGITTQRFKSIAVGTEGTCAGYYARQALISDGAMDRVAERMVVVERSVETVAEPAAGAVQLGLSFASLVSQATGVKLLLVVDGGLHERIQYTAVAAADSVQDEAVQTFLDLAALDAELQQLLTGYGLTSRKEALRVVPAG